MNLLVKFSNFKITIQVIDFQLDKQRNIMQINAYAPLIVKAYQKIIKIVDGDGLFVVDMFGRNETEIRLLGIDAPEIKRCKKLLQDERETHLPGQLLIELGQTSRRYLSDIAPVNTVITLVLEKNNSYDIYGRTLAYVLLPDGSCLNEMMVTEGYAKAYEKHSCNHSPKYQALNFRAKQEKRGHFGTVNRF